MNKPSRRAIYASLLALGLFFALQLMGAIAGGLVENGFAFPAAWASAQVLGAPLDQSLPHYPVVAHPLLQVGITPGCGGFDFFSLLAALLVRAVLGGRPTRRAGLWLLAALPTAYVITLLSNSARIVGAFYARELVADRLPADLAPAVHFADGVAVFLPVLIVVCYLWERSLFREHIPA